MQKRIDTKWRMTSRIRQVRQARQSHEANIAEYIIPIMELPRALAIPVPSSFPVRHSFLAEPFDLLVEAFRRARGTGTELGDASVDEVLGRVGDVLSGFQSGGFYNVHVDGII